MVIEIEHRISSLIYTKQEKYRPILYLFFLFCYDEVESLIKFISFKEFPLKKKK